MMSYMHDVKSSKQILFVAATFYRPPLETKLLRPPPVFAGINYSCNDPIPNVYLCYRSIHIVFGYVFVSIAIPLREDGLYTIGRSHLSVCSFCIFPRT